MSALWNHVPRTGRLTEPLALTSYVIFSLMLCIVPFPSFPWNQTSLDIWVTISYLFRLHSSHSDWNKTRLMSTTDFLHFSWVYFSVCLPWHHLLKSHWCFYLAYKFIIILLLSLPPQIWVSPYKCYFCAFFSNPIRWLSPSFLWGWWRSTKQRALCPMAWLSPQTPARR